MPKINIIYELDQDYLEDETLEYEIKMSNDKAKNVKVSDKIFYQMLDTGLLRKTDDGYVFVGNYEDLHGKKKKISI